MGQGYINNNVWSSIKMFCVLKEFKIFFLSNQSLTSSGGQSWPNITKTKLFKPVLLLLKGDSQRLEEERFLQEKEREEKGKQRLGDGGEKEDGRDREKETWKEQDTHRERDEEEAPLGCSGVWDRPIHTGLNTVSHCASVLSPRQPTLWPQTQS